MRGFAAILAAVSLGGSFGQASASTVSIEAESMIVDISVDVLVSAQAVVAHFSTGNEEALVVSLLPRGGSTFGIRTELPRKDFLVVFEAVGDPAQLSEPTSLSSMGATMTLPGSPEEPSEAPEERESSRWGWLALALAAGSLSALAFWVLGGRDDRPPGTADGDQGSVEEE